MADTASAATATAASAAKKKPAPRTKNLWTLTKIFATAGGEDSAASKQSAAVKAIINEVAEDLARCVVTKEMKSLDQIPAIFFIVEELGDKLQGRGKVFDELRKTVNEFPELAAVGVKFVLGPAALLRQGLGDLCRGRSAERQRLQERLGRGRRQRRRQRLQRAQPLRQPRRAEGLE